MNSSDCLKRFSQLKALAPGDAARVLDVLGALPPNPNQGGGSTDAALQFNRMLLALAIRAGNAEEVTRLVRVGGDGLRGNLDLAIQLWQGKHDQAAVSLIARPGEYHQGIREWFAPASAYSSNKEDRVLFTREIETGLAGWLTMIAEPAQRFRIECLISSLTDAVGDPAPQRLRRARLAALVERFPAEAPKARVSRNEILLALGSEGTAAVPLTNEYVAAIGKQTFAQLLPLRDNSSVKSAERDDALVTEILIRRAMQFALEESGDASLWIQQMESMHTAAIGNQESRATSMLREMAPWYSALLLRRIVELPVDQRVQPARQALAAARILLDAKQYDNYDLAVALAVTSQAAAGDGTALDRWLDGLPPNMRANYAARAKGHIGYQLRALKQPPLCGKEYDTSRRALLAAILMDTTTMERQMASEEAQKYAWDIQVYLLVFGNAQNGGLFTDDDLIAAIDMIPANHPNRAEFLVKKATLIEARDATPEEILTAYDIAEAAASGKAKSVNVVRSYRVRYLAGKGRRMDEAVAIAKTIDLDHLGQKQKSQIQALLQRTAARENKEK
ncbi:MAG: hypothetical protein NTV46_05810 [Verrucomicrobia bacterium]|nr:hypothetical protein [Verrucomicrobiota bacterium]